MGNIAGKFADQDPIILSGLSIAANNNLTAVRATIAETDQLQASSVVFQPTGLLATPASKLPNVATSLQGDISAALSGTGQAGTASEQPGGGGIPCFLAETLVTLWGGKRMRFIELYDLFTHLTPLQSMPRVLAFNEYDRVAGEIVEVMRNIKYEYAVVRFGDKTITEAVAEHRYWTGKEYVSIKNLVGKYIITETGKRTKVKSVTKVSVPEGVYVYNMHVRDYKNYCANRHRVHNLKPESSPGGPGGSGV